MTGRLTAVAGLHCLGLFHRLAKTILVVTLLTLLAAAYFGVGPAQSAPRPQPKFQIGAVTKLPLPRFVSLADDLAYGRVGPGTSYPIDYIYSAKHMPLEVIDEYESYRKVRDWQGSELWIFRPRLTNKRYLRIQVERTPLRQSADATAPVRAYLAEGVYGKVRQCRPDWCQIEVERVRGWVQTKAVYGTYEGESIHR